MAHTKHGKTPISRLKPATSFPSPTDIQDGVFVYSVQRDSKQLKLRENVCKEGGFGAAQLAWDDTDDDDVQHDAADLDAAQGLMILSGATAVEAARTSGIERVQRDESRRPRRPAKVALDELEDQDGYGFGVDSDEADVQLNKEEDEEMSDEADDVRDRPRADKFQY